MSTRLTQRLPRLAGRSSRTGNRRGRKAAVLTGLGLAAVGLVAALQRRRAANSSRL